jgi:hypothetical protein
MKKRLFLLTLLVALAAAPAFSFGIGGAFGLNWMGGPASGGLLSVKFDEFPAVIGVGARFSSGGFRIAVTADWWLYETNLVEMLDLYVGPGLFADVGTSVFDIGVRVPIGIHMFIIDPLELFFELAPAIGVSLEPDFYFPAWGIQGAVGFRFWF